MGTISKYFRRLDTILGHPANRGSTVKASLRALGWFFQAHILRRPIIVTTPEGIRLKMYPDSVMAKEWFYYNGYAANDALIFTGDFLQPGDRFLDLGANVGLFTCLAAERVGSTGRVDAVEPSPKTFARLSDNIALNDYRWVHPWHNALGNVNGEIDFTVSGDTVNHVVSSDGQAMASGHETVPIKRLDDLLIDDQGNASHYALAKLDIEGYELPCLEGSTTVLAKQVVDIWLIEVNGSSARYGFSDADLYALLHENGYQIFRYDARRRSVDVPDDFGDDILAVSPQGKKLLKQRLGLNFT